MTSERERLIRERRTSRLENTSVATKQRAQSFTTPVEEEKKPSGISRLLTKLTRPIVDVPDLPGGRVGEVFEAGAESLLSPIGLASAALVPVTGGASLGLRGAAGVGAKLGTRLLAEGATGAAAGLAAEKTSEALADAPGYVRLPATLLAGAAGGIGSARAISKGVKVASREAPKQVAASAPPVVEIRRPKIVNSDVFQPASMEEAAFVDESGRFMGAGFMNGLRDEHAAVARKALGYPDAPSGTRSAADYDLDDRALRELLEAGMVRVGSRQFGPRGSEAYLEIGGSLSQSQIASVARYIKNVGAETVSIESPALNVVSAHPLDAMRQLRQVFAQATSPEVPPPPSELAIRSASPEAGVLAEAIAGARSVPRREQKELLHAQRVSQNVRFREGVTRARAAGASPQDAIDAGRSAAKGEFRRLSFDAPQIEPKVTDALYDQATQFYMDRGMDLTVNTAKDALDKVLVGAVPPPHELRVLEEVYGPGLVEALRLHRGFGTRLAEAMNLPRALVASADFSAPLRQGVVLSAAHPIAFAKNLIPMFRAFADESYANRAIAALDDAPEAARAGRAGLARTAGKITSKEEAFLGNAFQTNPKGLINRALADGDRPLAGRLMDASERAYSLYLDKLRRDVFNGFTKKLDAAGIDNLSTEREYAAFLNRATGRGAERLLEGNLGKVANAAFFAPNYTISRFLAPMSLATADRTVQKEVAKDLGAFVGAGMTGLALLKMSGIADVETDPRSSDFGKVKVGNTRYDFWGGYQQIAKTVAQMATGESKSPTSGRIDEENRADVLGRFLRGKLSPQAGIGFDVLKGEDFSGETLEATPEGISAQAYARMVPLIFQDVMEGYQASGTKGALANLPAAFGLSASTFQSLSEIKDDSALRLFNKPAYRDLTGAEQRIVDQDPRVLAKEEEYAGRGSDFSVTADEIERKRLSGQQIGMARLASGQMSRKQFADFIEENQLRANVARDQARADFGIPDAEPTSALQIALDAFYGLYDQADLGFEQGIKTGQIDWDKYEALERDLFRRLGPEEIAFIEARRVRDNDPTVEWYFNDKKYVGDSGYYDITDAEFAKVAGRASRLGADDYASLVALKESGDRNTALRANAILKQVDKAASAKKETLRRRDPKLDRALFELGRTSTLLTPAAKRLGSSSL